MLPACAAPYILAGESFLSFFHRNDQDIQELFYVQLIVTPMQLHNDCSHIIAPFGPLF